MTDPNITPTDEDDPVPAEEDETPEPNDEVTTGAWMGEKGEPSTTPEPEWD